MPVVTFNQSMTFEVYECCNCGMAFAMTADFVSRRREDHASWYCPKGHAQSFRGETEAEKLRRECDRLKQNEAYLEFQITVEQKERAKQEKELKRVKRRALAGVCPCCNKTFTNVHAHVRSEHPESLAEIGVNVVPIRRNRSSK